MKRYLIIAIVLAVMANLSLAEKQQICEKMPEANLKSVVTGNTAFALDLYAKLKGDPNATDENLFFSPYSISTALALAWSGARGETEKQMTEVLHFPLPQEQLHPAFGALETQLNEQSKEGHYQLNVANALWGQNGYCFLPEFLDTTNKYYGAGLRTVDFVTKTEDARKTINVWVEEKTNEKIKELIMPGLLSPMTRLVLTNAIYFKGDWAIQFDKKKTADAKFTISADKKTVVPMMNLKENFKYDQTDLFQIIELPYKGDQLSMIVILPKRIDYLDRVEKELVNSDKPGHWFKRLRKRDVIVYLPKFKITWGVVDLTKTLSDMGMPAAFMKADFSGMDGTKNLLISNVVHKAFVEVNEEGTEAAAATGIAMKLTSMPAPPQVFRADHPFIFIIKDNQSGSILFMGKVVNPTKKD